MLLETVAVVGLVKNAIDIGKQAKEAISITEKQEKIESLIARLIDIHVATYELVQEKNQLQMDIKKYEEFELERKRYILHELAPAVFIYLFDKKLPGNTDSLTPEHILCVNCFEKHQKSFLQRSGQTLKGIHYRCDSCNSELIDHSKQIDAACATVEIAGRRSLLKGY